MIGVDCFLLFLVVYLNSLLVDALLIVFIWYYPVLYFVGLFDAGFCFDDVNFASVFAGVF